MKIRQAHPNELPTILQYTLNYFTIYRIGGVKWWVHHQPRPGIC
jgi:hypothetical protein